MTKNFNFFPRKEDWNSDQAVVDSEEKIMGDNYAVINGLAEYVKVFDRVLAAINDPLAAINPYHKLSAESAEDRLAVVASNEPPLID